MGMCSMCRGTGVRHGATGEGANACIGSSRASVYIEAYVHSFMVMNVHASDCRVGRRSNRPSEGWPVPLVLKTLNFPAVVTN